MKMSPEEQEKLKKMQAEREAELKKAKQWQISQDC